MNEIESNKLAVETIEAINARLDEIETERAHLEAFLAAKRQQLNLLKPKEVAGALSIPLPTVYYLISHGVIPAIKIGGRYRVKSSTIQKIQEKGTVAA